MSVGLKLVAGSVVILASLAGLAYLGASSSWQYYLTAEECLAQGAQLAGRRLRVAGHVVPGSVQPDGSDGQMQFALAGATGRLRVRCICPLPDSFAEQRDVVVEGRLEQPDLIVASRVLTRCASKYEPQ